MTWPHDACSRRSQRQRPVAAQGQNVIGRWPPSNCLGVRCSLADDSLWRNHDSRSDEGRACALPLHGLTLT